MKFLFVPHPKRGGQLPVPCLAGPILTANRTILGHAPLTVHSHQACSNLLKILTLLGKKLCPQTKFAAILKL
jgi:hypothetical protein